MGEIIFCLELFKNTPEKTKNKVKNRWNQIDKMLILVEGSSGNKGIIIITILSTFVFV